MVGDETIKIDGRSHVKEVVDGMSYLVSPTAFFQTNVGAAADAREARARGNRWRHERVLDLYCGSGLFSLPIAKAGATVTAVEENRQAINDAEANVRLNRMPAGPDSVHRRPRRRRARAGSARIRGTRSCSIRRDRDARRAVIAGVFEQHPAGEGGLRVLQSGCAREGIAGYPQDRLPRHARAAVDMFPHTDHIETVMAFARK